MAIAQRCTVFAAITAAALLTTGRCWVHGAEPSPDAGERTKLTIGKVTFAFRWCPPGEFLMGSRDDSKERYGDMFVPQHRVQISKGFWLQETEVTQAQYKMVTGTNPSFWQSSRSANNPVEQLSWTDAVQFCRELSQLDPHHEYRLPSEAEWEYACRAGNPAVRYGEIMEIAWVFMNTDEGDGSTGHRPVGKKKPNRWGLHDMFGNVAEWCSDWYGPAPSELTSDPTGPDTGVCRIVRGDDCFVCWTFLNADGACMAASRGEGRRPEDVSRTLGFRIVQIPVSTPKVSEIP